MDFSKISTHTTVLVKNLQIDVNLPGPKPILKGHPIPKKRLKQKPSPEQKSGFGQVTVEQPRDILEEKYEIITSRLIYHPTFGKVKCKALIVLDRETMN